MGGGWGDGEGEGAFIGDCLEEGEEVEVCEGGAEDVELNKSDEVIGRKREDDSWYFSGNFGV